MIANIFAHPVSCLFTLIKVSSHGQKFLVFKVHTCVSPFLVRDFCNMFIFKKSLPTLGHEDILLSFFLIVH